MQHTFLHSNCDVIKTREDESNSAVVLRTSDSLREGLTISETANLHFDMANALAGCFCLEDDVA